MENTSEIKPYQTLRGHTRGVQGVVHLPDGRRIITCSDDGSLRLWDREIGAQIGNDWREDGDKAGVWTIALSPNGKTVASGSTDGTVRLWDIEMKKVTVTWTRHIDGVWSVCWSPDGGRVATGFQNGTVRVWEVESGETVLGTIKTGHRYVNAVVYSPDGSKIAIGGYRQDAISIWDARTGELLSRLKQHYDVFSLAWTSDQKKLIASGDNDTIIFNTATWEQSTILEGHTRAVYAISLFQNDRLLASSSWDKTVRLWNLDTNLPVGPPLQHQDSVYDIALSSDEQFLVTACSDNNAYVWDIHMILEDAGLEDLSSVKNVKSILDSDATRRPRKVEVPRSVPQGFFDDVQSSTTPINPPPATAGTNPPPSATHSNPPVSTTQSDSSSSTHPRRHILPFFSVSGAHALLRRVLPRFHRSQPNTNQPTNLQQHSGERPASVDGLADVQVPAVPDNQFITAAQPDPPRRLAQLDDPLDCCNTTANGLLDSSRPLVNYRSSGSANDVNSPSSFRVNGITNFFGWIGPPSDAKEKHKQRRLNRGAPNVVDVPLGQATYGDYVAGPEDGIRPYSLFFCLGWCRKREKKPDLPPQVYDVDLMRAEQEEVPVHTTRFQSAQQGNIEMIAMTSQSQPEAGPSRHPLAGNLEHS